MYVARDEAEKQAAHERSDMDRQRVLAVSRWPDRADGSHILAYSHSEASRATLIGTADEIADKLEALRRVGVAYVILNCGGSRKALRRFAREIMPAF